MLRGILSLSLAKSQVGSAPPQNLAEEGTVWKHWRRPLEGMGRRGGSAERRARQAVHSQGSRLRWVGPPRHSWGSRNVASLFQPPGCDWTSIPDLPMSGLSANKPDKYRHAPNFFSWSAK